MGNWSSSTAAFSPPDRSPRATRSTPPFRCPPARSRPPNSGSAPQARYAATLLQNRIVGSVALSVRSNRMTTPLGKYRLVKLIASGGMAEVYLAKQAGAAGFEKMVCLKRILPHLARDKQFVEMFLHDARVAARLDHPNIVSIFDLGEANGNYFVAMEFIDGPSLRAVARRAHERGERLPIAEVVKIVSMAAGGLHYAHDLAGPDGKPLGLVHRDISPDNILVHRNGMAKVVDFGIAKAANSSGMTRTGTLKGNGANI